MSAWIGPAIIAAVISGLIQWIGWMMAERRDPRADQRRRDERVRDLQTAVRAEIRSHLHHAGTTDITALIEERSRVIARILEPTEDKTPFMPFVPKTGKAIVFESIAKEIHILPVAVIDPVILFYRQIEVLSLLADDLRSDRVLQLEATRRAALYTDYLAIAAQANAFAVDALEALDQSLKTHRKRQ